MSDELEAGQLVAAGRYRVVRMKKLLKRRRARTRELRERRAGTRMEERYEHSRMAHFVPREPEKPEHVDGRSEGIK